MKTIYILLALITIASCSSENPKEESANSTAKVVSFPLQTVKENSIKRKSYIFLDSVDLSKLTAIDSAFFKRYFLGLPVSNIEGYKVEFDPYSRYYFYDYKDIGDLALFSIIHDDEVGYDNLYHFTYDQVKKQLLYIDYLAATGSDGGDRNYDKLKYNKDGDSLIHTMLSSHQEYIKDGEGSVTQNDSVIYQVLFSKNGTRYLKLDSVSRMDTVWSEK